MLCAHLSSSVETYPFHHEESDRCHLSSVSTGRDSDGAVKIKRRKLRSASTATSKAILFTTIVACITLFSFVEDTARLLMVNPRKLMAEQGQTSFQADQQTRGRAVLLRNNYFPPMNTVLQEVNLTANDGNDTHASSTSPRGRRVVYLEGDHEAWLHRPAREYSISVYPRIVPPGEIYQSSSQDDKKPRDSLEDLTRWYPQIDSGDEDFHIERRLWPRHEIDPENCHPMHDWQSTSFPNCNTIHEKDFLHSIVRNEMDMVSKKGFWRRAWGSADTVVPNNRTMRKKMVWKTFKIHHSMEDAFFENNRVDALAMERLTASPYVIGIYGYCAMTVVQEFAGKQIHEQPLGPWESFDVAIQVAAGIRDIHYIGNSDRPVMVHNDINLANILVADDGRPVLNDFNIAILLMEREVSDSSEVCPFYSRFPNPQWRSPEEQVQSEEESRTNPPIVDEKIDIYAMGNVLFRLIAGGSPWKEKGAIKLSPEEKTKVALAKRYNGTLPDVPSHVNLDQPVMKILYQAMQMCYRFNPRDRPTARELVDFLVTARSNLNHSYMDE